MTAPMQVARRMTAADFLALPERQNATRLELVGGEVIVNEPTWLHMSTLHRLQLALGIWATVEDGRGAVSAAVDVGIDERNVFAPDLLWYARGRVPGRHDPAPYPVPDLAVEVRSPSTWAYDVGAKKTAYERHGLRELWLVDTMAEEVLAFRRSKPGPPDFDVSLELARGAMLSSPLLPGFAVPVDQLFDG